MHDDARFNAAFWDQQADAYQEQVGPSIALHPLCWGAFFVPEHLLGVLDLDHIGGQSVLELGCGGARWSIELARLGATCTGVDPSRRQLAHARAHVEAAGQTLNLVEAAASELPLGDASVDLIFSDHGGLTYDDPARVLPECARVLRPGGRLVFNTTSPWAEVCLDAEGTTVTRRLERSYFELGRVANDDGVSWVLPHGRWIALLTESGFVVDALHELRPPDDATRLKPTHWARRWPAEELWCATRR